MPGVPPDKSDTGLKRIAIMEAKRAQKETLGKDRKGAHDAELERLQTLTQIHSVSD